MSQSTQSPLGRFVLFCVCLAIAGGILAGAHYLAIDQPHQAALRPPTNHFYDAGCWATYQAAVTECYRKCDKSDGETDYDCYWPCERPALCTMLRCDDAIQSTPEVRESLVTNNC